MFANCFIFCSRSSAFGRQSAIGTGAGGQALRKDPRNIRDKQWQVKNIKKLISFMTEAGKIMMTKLTANLLRL